jgi:hypothetical protein
MLLQVLAEYTRSRPDWSGLASVLRNPAVRWGIGILFAVALLYLLVGGSGSGRRRPAGWIVVAAAVGAWWWMRR